MCNFYFILISYFIAILIPQLPAPKEYSLWKIM